jgi:electron transfer flavoprotein beta subunit
LRPRTHDAAAPPTGSPRERLLQLTGALVDHDPPTVVGPLDAAAGADALLSFLARNGYSTPVSPPEGAAAAGGPR